MSAVHVFGVGISLTVPLWFSSSLLVVFIWTVQMVVYVFGVLISFVFSWTVRMMCNLDSESVAIERIREYDNLPQVGIVIKIINIIMDRMSFLFFIGVIILVILRKLLGRHRQSSPLHWIGQTGERFSSSSSSSPLLSHCHRQWSYNDPIDAMVHNFPALGGQRDGQSRSPHATSTLQNRPQHFWRRKGNQ